LGGETYLNLRVGKLATNQTLGVEDGVVRVHGDLVLGGITNQALGVCEGNERGGGAVALVIGNDIASILAEDTHAGVRGTQIDTDGGTHGEDV
jgi:hypothetical protein